MNVERMLAVIDAVERTPESHFDMSTWGMDDIDCGFAGCAIGSYAHLNPGCGLELSISGDDGFDSDETEYFVKSDQYKGFYAVADHLGIDEDESRHLFDCLSYEKFEPSKQEVLDRLRTFVTENR